MLKATAQGSATRERILDAAFETLRQEGFAQTSARAVARRGGFNQALIFYHFGSLQELLLAAMDRMSERRMERYRGALAGATTPDGLATLARRLYAEDIASGHASVVAELFAASSGSPALREQMLSRMRPWLEFTEDLIRRFVGESPLASLIEPKAAASAALALYLGLDLLIHLEGHSGRATDLFDAGDRLASILGPIFGGEQR